MMRCAAKHWPLQTAAGSAEPGERTKQRQAGVHRLTTHDMDKAFQKILQNFSDFPSHRIFRRMYRVLNIDKNKNELHNLVGIYETNLLSLVSL